MSTQNSKTLLVRDVMLELDCVPTVKEQAIFKKALEEMGRTHLGIICIVNDKNQLLGIITDGDIRRKLLLVQKPSSAFFVDDALDHSIHTPIVVSPGDTLLHAVELMEQKQVWDLPVIDGDALVGLLHLHHAVRVLLES